MVRSELGKATLDQAFAERDELQVARSNRAPVTAFLLTEGSQVAVAASLAGKVAEYGYLIRKVLLTDLQPAKAVKAEMVNIYVQTLHTQVPQIVLD
jgi:hypothetical protein